jgi:hypothetical protein
MLLFDDDMPQGYAQTGVQTRGGVKSILAEGAIARPMTLSGGVLIAS